MDCIQSKNNNPSSQNSVNLQMQQFELSDGIGNILRNFLIGLSTAAHTYNRFEMVLDNETDELSLSEAVTNNTIPDCSLLNAPLCRLFNSTNSREQMMKYLNSSESDQENLLTFSFHRLAHC